MVVLDLAKELACGNIVPVALIDNATLAEAILLRQSSVLETVDNAVMPKAPQGPTFTYRMNAKEEMTWSFRRRISEEIQALEKETGVHLDHYHKLRIENKEIDKHFIFT